MSDRTPPPAFPATLHLPPSQLPDEPVPLEHRLSLLPERSRKALIAGLTTSAPFHIYIAADPEIAFERDLGVLAEGLAPPAVGVDLLSAPNPQDPAEPLIIELPAGKGPPLRDAVEASLRALARRLARITRSESQRAADRALGRDLDARSREAISSLETRARDLGFGVRATGGTLQTFPILHGKPLTSEQIGVLDEATRKRLSEAEDHLSEAVEAVAAQLSSLAEDTEVARGEATQRAAEALIDAELTSLRAAFADVPPALDYFELLSDDLRAAWRELLDPGHPLRGTDEPSPGRRFGLHLLLSTEPGARTMVESHLAPTARELFGYIAARSLHGSTHADFTSLRPGALVRCAQGVLLLRALDLIRDPELWPRLRRALLNNEVELQGPDGCHLQPEAIPIAPRVVLLGPEEIHAELIQGDPDFLALFPVKVEIEPFVDRTDESVHDLDAFLVGRGRLLGWLPFDLTARARLIDLATRLAEDRHKLSLALMPLEETVALASDSARRVGRAALTAADIDEAWSDRRARRAGPALQALRQFTEGMVLIETDGRRVGVVNGLAVFFSADLSFGQPMRLTAVVCPGTEGVVDVERESHLGGDIHSKGVAILRGLMSRLFGQDRPLNLRAQLTFEQSYGEVDGDSASSTEFFAILSALAEVPVDQGLAVTGAISQLGEVQAIGGVCDKIEGFFDLCSVRGLTGRQGVIIPRSNLRHLVLRDDIVHAIEAGKFHIHPIDDVRQGIELLAGVPAGERDAEGKFPAASVFGRAERRLIELAERLRETPHGPPEPFGPDGDLADPDALLRRG